MAEHEPVNVLWTGGWDSTFRVLDLALLRGVVLQPWYLRDAERASTPLEEATMAGIREAVVHRDSEAGACILPTRVVGVEEVEPDSTITARYQTTGLGSQYDWLARFAQQWAIDRLELGIVKHGRIHGLLAGNLKVVSKAGGTVHRLCASPSDPNLLLFEPFDFPLLTHTKVEMRGAAKAAGMLDIMRQTWFCHEPSGGRPCGHCTPCSVAIEEGMSWRIPPHRRVRHYFRKAKRKLISG